jgi:hypothetical protein
MFGLERSYRSLTLSPFASVLAAARRMARPHLHLEDGGSVPAGRVDDQHSEHDFMLPSDVREQEVLSAIQDQLRAPRYSTPMRDRGAAYSFKTTADGRVFVPADVVLLLGDGAADRGKRVLEKIVNEIRHRRVLNRLAVIPAVKAGR